MNILIISGGSGNDALVKGLKKFYPEAGIHVLVNAYDAGKSTGVCRKVTNTLGVSDIRKNHIRMYKAVTANPDQSIVEFYDARYDFTKGNEVAEIKAKLTDWGLEDLCVLVDTFFENPTATDYDYTDFNVSNIIYAAMYQNRGYEFTNNFFCNRLGLDDFVILNSFDNVYIKAETASGHVIEEEGELVEYCNPDDIIVKMHYDCDHPSHGLTERARKEIDAADLIVISTGTFWSSIFPTLEYQDLYKYINRATAKKIWAMNCNQDKDCYGVGSNKLIEFVDNLGLNLKDFTILENSDAVAELREANDEFNVVYEAMGNNDGKHDGERYARAILKYYYGLKAPEEYSNIIFDFDDTLWARDAKENAELMTVSRENVTLVGEHLARNSCIISGNTYESIAKKLATVFGSDKSKFDVDIWADANAIRYRNGVRQGVVPELMISGNIEKLGKHLNDMYAITLQPNDKEYVSCLKIKPLSNLDQALVANYLNDYLLAAMGLGFCRAMPTGRTTVDIVNKNNSKLSVISAAEIDAKNALYIGDENDTGNDAVIANACGSAIHVSGVKETNAVLKLLTEMSVDE